ncbi:UDP-N-acetylmuramate--L-alanine ligase [Gemelliphila palaticanis]|uniref:UDP-N-acetylmuramate--L-alanine ligase n=1 Tax=Gemelliphila palaticanis TaxID=81950 RepID=A0ABX2SZS2_9BACL|nr:UDP-N-acetylmuramate--L-alanine ligase [Gemella palaticanis]MBF0715952.1 UDP-N-acetylmuramate--L-alanine ligase [Gemella palaticanis]NYS47882.1 UDP-N-acetylmuramate--L-alanine ligase [Gemella palaticanis]
MNKYHFIGIKGSGMSPMAQILHDMGHYVQGSDVDTYFFTQKKLEERNIKILPHSIDNIKEGLIVILGNAFKENQEEYIKAKELGLQTYTYSEMLGQLSDKLKSIAITGAHGKTTTTTMASTLFKDNKDTSYLIGDGSGFGFKNPDLFVFEACEYYRHFLHYKPTYAIVTNVDFDHPDYFKSEDDVLDAFQNFVDNVKDTVVYCGDDRLASKLKSKSAKMVSYGFNDNNDYQAKNLVTNELGTEFEVYKEGSYFGTFNMPVFGLHEVSNALAVIALGDIEGLTLSQMQISVKNYKNASRRFTEYKYKDNIIVDDYAHHPKEIVATINTARRKYKDKEVVAVFQPHTFTRTEAFLEDFADSLKQADLVYLYPIFGSAREQKGNVTIEDLQNIIPKSRLVDGENSFKDFENMKNSVILFMGAGDINKYQQRFLETVLEKTL